MAKTARQLLAEIVSYEMIGLCGMCGKRPPLPGTIQVCQPCEVRFSNQMYLFPVRCLDSA